MAYGLTQDNVLGPPSEMQADLTKRSQPTKLPNVPGYPNPNINQADLMRWGLAAPAEDPSSQTVINGGGTGGGDAATNAWGDVNNPSSWDQEGAGGNNYSYMMDDSKVDTNPVDANGENVVDPFATPETEKTAQPTWGDFWQAQSQQKADPSAGIGSNVGQVGGGIIGGIYGGPAGATIGAGVGKTAGSMVDWFLNQNAAAELEDKKNKAEAQQKKFADYQEALMYKNQAQNDTKYQQSQDAYQHNLDLQRQREELTAAQAVHQIYQARAQRMGLGGAGMNEYAGARK